MPALNLVIERYWDKKELLVVCAKIAFLSLIYKLDLFLIANGYSTVWISLLYIVGVLKKEGDRC